MRQKSNLLLLEVYTDSLELWGSHQKLIVLEGVARLLPFPNLISRLCNEVRIRATLKTGRGRKKKNPTSNQVLRLARCLLLSVSPRNHPFYEGEGDLKRDHGLKTHGFKVTHKAEGRWITEKVHTCGQGALGKGQILEVLLQLGLPLGIGFCFVFFFFWYQVNGTGAHASGCPNPQRCP